MKQTSLPTYTATIYMGLKEGYDGLTHNESEAWAVLRDYCDEVGFAVTITPTVFIYTGGAERGVVVGLINYPRFPKEPAVIKMVALTLAERLMKRLKQQRCTVVCSDETIMLEGDDL